MILTDNQELAIRHTLAGDDVAVKGGHGTGSTFTLAMCMVRLMSERPGVGVIMVAPTRGRIFNILLRDVNKIMLDIGIHGQVQSNGEVSIGDSHAEPLGPFSYTLPTLDRERTLALIVEGADSVPVSVLTRLEDLWGASIQTIMSGMPLRKSGLLWHAFRWNRITNSAVDCPRVSKHAIDCMADHYGPDSDAYRSRALGEFPV